jgi:hypothetical protein
LISVADVIIFTAGTKKSRVIKIPPLCGKLASRYAKNIIWKDSRYITVPFVHMLKITEAAVF